MVKARRRRLAAGVYQFRNRYQFGIDATRNRYQQIRVLVGVKGGALTSQLCIRKTLTS
jgi:hypothetical protein